MGTVSVFAGGMDFNFTGGPGVAQYFEIYIPTEGSLPGGAGRETLVCFFGIWLLILFLLFCCSVFCRMYAGWVLCLYSFPVTVGYAAAGIRTKRFLLLAFDGVLHD